MTLDWKWRSLMTDGKLVRAVLSGDRERFAVIVERHQRDMYNLAYRSTGDRHDAEDIVQETFLRAFRSLSKYDTTRSLRTWLYAIAVNVCRDWARRRKSRPRGTALLEGAGAVDTVKGPLQPHEVAIERDRQRAVQRAVTALSPEYRLPLILFYMRGLPQAEIAEIMGVPISVVKNRLYRARRRMRATLGSILDDGDVREGAGVNE